MHVCGVQFGPTAPPALELRPSDNGNTRPAMPRERRLIPAGAESTQPPGPTPGGKRAAGARFQKPHVRWWYRADFVRKAPKKFRFAVRQGRFTRPDLSGWAGRVDSRDRAVGCAAQEIFMMALRAAGRRVMNTGVHPRHFSSGFYLGVRACVRVCKRCETTARGARWDKKAGLPPLPSLLHLEIPSRSPERLRCRARVCRVGGRRQL
jgi:hypothetical protein